MYRPLMKVGELVDALKQLPRSATVLVMDVEGAWSGIDRLRTTSSDPTGGNLGVASVLLMPIDRVDYGRQAEDERAAEALENYRNSDHRSAR